MKGKQDWLVERVAGKASRHREQHVWSPWGGSKYKEKVSGLDGQGSR